MRDFDLELAVQDLLAYGTPEGLEKAWDTRGRGRKVKEAMLPIPVYRGTTTHKLPEIEKQGFVPTKTPMKVDKLVQDPSGGIHRIAAKPKQGNVYVTGNIEAAKNYAEFKQKYNEAKPGGKFFHLGTWVKPTDGAPPRSGTKPIVVTMRLPVSIAKQLKSDPESSPDLESFMYKGTIPKEYIEKVEMLDGGRWKSVDWKKGIAADAGDTVTLHYVLDDIGDLKHKIEAALEQLDIDAAVEELLAHNVNEGVGTKKTGYALPEMGPFECEHCVHVSEDGTRCDHPDVLADKDIPKTPNQKLAIVDPHACCNYFHPLDELEAYGTSEGVEKEWDTRGRGRKVDPKELLEVVKIWQQNPSRVKNYATQLVTTGKVDGADATGAWAANALVNGIRTGETSTGTMYRGISLQGDDPILHLKVGDEFQLPAPQSFSGNMGVARSFSIGKQQGDTHVLFAVPKLTGLNVAKINPASEAEGFAEDEFLTNGKFKVTGVEELKGYGGNRFHEIEIEQEGTL